MVEMLAYNIYIVRYSIYNVFKEVRLWHNPLIKDAELKGLKRKSTCAQHKHFRRNRGLGMIEVIVNKDDQTMQYSEEDLNLLYEKSLEFGEHWRRPLTEWAQELWQEWDKEKQAEISRYIKTVRSEIEEYINDKYDWKAEKLTESEEEIKSWIKCQYKWMSRANIAHGYSQGRYYAWHG